MKQNTTKIKSRTLLSTAWIGMACLAIGLWGCASPDGFPRGYRQVRAELRVWQNIAEGFSLTLITASDRTQGFAEWRNLGIYGRIVGATKAGDTISILLGDGGMNGTELRIRVMKRAIEARCALPDGAPEAARKQASSVRIVADRVDLHFSMKLSTGTVVEKQRNGRDVSMRLQYVTSSRTLERNLFDEALRRGKSVRDAAIFRRTQQEASPVVLYDKGAQEPAQGSLGDAAQSSLSALPAGSAPPQPPLVYEEAQYPVYVSQRYISVATQRYLFSGGAHGAASTDFDVIDLEKGERLGPDDMLSEGWRTGLLPALSAELLRQGTFAGLRPEGGLKALGLFESKLSAPDKVFLCLNGVGFEYDRYQIAPWAMGEYIVVLPWNQVKPYLKNAIKPF